MIKRGLLLLIKIYRQYIGILFPPTCRFYPSCSQYAYEAIVRYGVRKGIWLATLRLLKCHPFHPGGYNPVGNRSSEFSAIVYNNKVEIYEDRNQ